MTNPDYPWDNCIIVQIYQGTNIQNIGIENHIDEDG